MFFPTVSLRTSCPIPASASSLGVFGIYGVSWGDMTTFGQLQSALRDIPALGQEVVMRQHNFQDAQALLLYHCTFVSIP